MKISIKKLAKFADNFYQTLKGVEIDSQEKLEKKIGHVFQLNGVLNEYIQLTMRPSGGGKAYTASYISPGLGIPIQFRINDNHNYLRFILKSVNLIDEYLPPFAKDRFGNKMQEKVFSSGGIVEAIHELDRLRNLHPASVSR